MVPCHVSLKAIAICAIHSIKGGGVSSLIWGIFLPSFCQSSISLHSKTAPLPICNSLRKMSLLNAITSAVGGQFLIPLPEASVINIWTASTSEHSSSPTLLSSLETHAQKCQLSKWCWLHSLMKREGRERDFSEEQTQQHKIIGKRTSLSAPPPSNKFLLTALHAIISIQQH